MNELSVTFLGLSAECFRNAENCFWQGCRKCVLRVDGDPLTNLFLKFVCRFWTMREKLSSFCRIFFDCCCQDSFPHVHQNILRKNCSVFKTKLENDLIILGNSAKKIPAFAKNFLTDLSKMQFSWPEEQFEQKIFLKKLHIFSSVSDTELPFPCLLSIVLGRCFQKCFLRNQRNSLCKSFISEKLYLFFIF